MHVEQNLLESRQRRQVGKGQEESIYRAFYDNLNHVVRMSTSPLPLRHDRLIGRKDVDIWLVLSEINRRCKKIIAVQTF